MDTQGSFLSEHSKDFLKGRMTEILFAASICPA